MSYPLLCVFACACANVAIIPAISTSQLTVFQQKITFFSWYLYSPTYVTTCTKASDIKRRQKEMLTKQPRHTTSLLSDTLRRLMDDCLVLPQIVSSPLSSKEETATKQSRKYRGKKKQPRPVFSACVHNHNITNTAFRRSG